MVSSSSAFDPHSPHLVVFDFDGTLTDAEAEGAPFRDGYLRDIATLTGWSMERIEQEASSFEQEVATQPERYGWLFQGQIVAPATVDPYLRMMPVARHLLDSADALMQPTDRERVLDGLLYKYNYQKTVTAFRDQALETLCGLINKGLLGTTGELYVVTNSHTDAVQNKLRILESQRLELIKATTSTTVLNTSLMPLIERVHGRAQKYIVDNRFDQVEEALELTGLNRPVLLRRRHYYEVLNALREKAGVQWSQVWVFGDIFELDLCLPLTLGASVGLMTNNFTPVWERDYLMNHPRGYLLNSLSQVHELLSTSRIHS